jgi:catechol 2,3-dioxygenase-like lactoylglutathione lyase family enzyme
MSKFSHRVALLLLSCLAVGVAPAAAPTAASPAFPKFGNPLQLTPHHLTASVADVERAVEWYRMKLGFEVQEKGMLGTGDNKTPFAELRIASFGIAFIQARGGPNSPDPAKPVVPRLIHMVFGVPDPQATFDLLKSRGVDVAVRPAQKTTPISIFQFHDSEGNEIEVMAASAP